MANKLLNDSNFIDVTVDVVSAGAYTISTDSLNGYIFKATGTFSNTGTTTVRLKGNGKPVNAAVDNFTVVFDSSACNVSVTVLPPGTTGGPASYSLQKTGSACASFVPSGNYVKDTSLKTSNTVSVQVNVTTVGTYSITTNTVNGYSFSGSGTFGATGLQTVSLQASGKPIAAGTDNFTATAGTSTCVFPITVTATAPPPTGPCGATAQGTYTAGTALTALNTITISHTYSTAGSYTVSTATVNGYLFGPSTITATAGANTITLKATGTPAASGTNTFVVSFGDGQTCSFTVTVVAGTPPVTNTDYFPITLNSYWTYDTNGSDTFKVVNTGPVTLSGTTFPFQRFTYSDAGGAYSRYYRKDPVTEYYYESIDTAGNGPDLTFTQPRIEVQFLRNVLTTGQTWNSPDINATYQGSPIVLRFKYTCLSAAATVVVNGKTFTNAYKIEEIFQVGRGGIFTPQGTTTLYYVKGVGLVQTIYDTGSDNIRYWQVF
ncbi:MAG: hypothetical protein M3Y85_05950 [Bacteroidota bacterium]|nr:hypothetical protein [Bacteroidota bacterium]